MVGVNKNIIAEKLKKALHEAEMSQVDLGKELGISQAQVNYWVQGHRKPNLENLQKIASILDKPLEYFLSTKKETTKEYINRVKVATDIQLVPVRGISSATNEKFVLEEEDGTFIGYTKTGEKQFAIKVEGNCMVDPKDPQNSIFNGDYVVIDPQVVPYDGDIVLARISEEYSTIKRMYIKGDYVYLVPDNPKCKALKKKKTEIKSFWDIFKT